MTKKGFTLAEVLITLGVIGVVASITLPTLIKEYNKHVWVSALKENYSLLNQGFKKMIADDGVEYIADTEVWRSMGEWKPWLRGCDSSNISSGNCKDFFDQLKKYFKITYIGIGSDNYIGSNGTTEMGYKYKYRNSSKEFVDTGKIIYLSNGAMIWGYNFDIGCSIRSDCDELYAAGGNMCGRAGHFKIDINGNRGPNEFGKDIFMFYITERGQLAPYGGNDYAMSMAWGSGFSQEKLDKYKAKKGLKGECLMGSGMNGGEACAGLLIDQLNWKMDY